MKMTKMSAQLELVLKLFFSVCVYIVISSTVVSSFSIQHPNTLCITCIDNDAWQDTEKTENVDCSGNVSRKKAGIDQISRRRILPHLLVWISSSSAAFAAFTPSSSVEKDKEKLELGYNRLTYLIDNWEKETTFCNSGIDNPYVECERKPEKVMEYLGYKNQLDPLFRADKTLIRLQQTLVNISPDDQAEFQDALDTWIEKAQEGSGLGKIIKKKLEFYLAQHRFIPFSDSVFFLFISLCLVVFADSIPFFLGRS